MTETLKPAARDIAPLQPSSYSSIDPVPPVSKAAWWAGWIITGIIVLWMGVLGIILSLTQRAMVEENMAKYGYPVSAVMPIFIVEIICVILYAIPRTSVLGAILLTGYLGGAVATHVRAGEPWFFPVIFGVLVWLGLFLRDRHVRDLVPLRKA